jgi:pyrroline-5-carboxylate reductase
MLNKRVAIIGAGKMGRALIEGLISSRIILPKDILISDKLEVRLRPLSRKGIKTTTSNIEAVKVGKIVVLCVKPQDMREVLKEIADSFQPSQLKNKLFISIAAGIKTDFIEKRLGRVPVIRVMPNTPALVREGTSVVSRGAYARSRHEDIARRVFESVGKVLKFPEKYMDAVTALSGSGPAYFFFLMEALIDAGKRLGIRERASAGLILQVAFGASVLAKESNLPPAKLRDMVTSKGGTTEAALKVLKYAKVKEAIIEAVIQAKKRSQQISKK